MNDDVEKIRVAAGQLSAARHAARGPTIEAIRKLELAVIDALGGEQLRGLPEHAAPGQPRFQAARVRGKPDARIDGRPVLVLVTSGRLMMASQQADGIECRPVTDDELVIDDLEALTRTIYAVTRDHVRRTDFGVRSYDRAHDLARWLTREIDIWSSKRHDETKTRRPRP